MVSLSITDTIFPSKGMKCPTSVVNVMTFKYPFPSVYYMELGECLGKERSHLEQTWKEVLGRYDMAVQQLMVEVIIQSKNPVEKILQALCQNVLTAEVCQRATETIKKGYFLHLYCI